MGTDDKKATIFTYYFEPLKKMIPQPLQNFFMNTFTAGIYHQENASSTITEGNSPASCSKKWQIDLVLICGALKLVDPKQMDKHNPM